MTLTAGIDIGAGCVKSALIEKTGDDHRLVGTQVHRIRRRDLKQVINENYEHLLTEFSVSRDAVDYVATTGEGELVDFRRGHFYSMTTHARGALFLMPDATCCLDIGALHGRAIRYDSRGKVLQYRMTSQCASGSGQFLENIARYLGVALEEVGELSISANDPEVPSSICAVLAETDVINMVSRGISTANILKGIHLSMAGRLVKLLRAIGAEGDVALTGGLAGDDGLKETIRETIEKAGTPVRVVAHDDSISAGAIGAAIWGAFRHEKISSRKMLPV